MAFNDEYANLYVEMQALKTQLSLADKLAKAVDKWWDDTSYYHEEAEPLLLALHNYKRERSL